MKNIIFKQKLIIAFLIVAFVVALVAAVAYIADAMAAIPFAPAACGFSVLFMVMWGCIVLFMLLLGRFDEKLRALNALAETQVPSARIIYLTDIRKGQP